MLSSCWARTSSRTCNEPGATPTLGKREPWFTAFFDLLVTHGADQAVTEAAIDRLADLFAATYLGLWNGQPAATPSLRGWD